MPRTRPTVLLVPFTAALLGFAGAVHGCSDLPVEPLQPGQQGITTPGVVGDPCIPTNEKKVTFGGFSMLQGYVESGAFASCESGICLINHFQGRVSCPLGQAAPAHCNGPSDTTTCGAEKCVESGEWPIRCNPSAADQGAGVCAPYGGACDPQRANCVCQVDEHCPEGTHCDASTGVCRVYVCAMPGACQLWNASDADNQGKACCAPDTGKPTAEAVCGQCGQEGQRDAEGAVYCSCRCAPPDNVPPGYDAEYCTCPDGFECTKFMEDFGLGGELDVAGSYCVKQGSVFKSEAQCGVVSGNMGQPPNQFCAGLAGAP